MSFREIGLATDKFAENADGAGSVVVLAENQAQLNARVSVFGIKADGFVEFACGFIELSGLRQSQAEIVMGFW